MGCDWDAATAVDTFFKDPEGYTLTAFNSWSEMLDSVVLTDETDPDPYRNPVTRRLGLVCHCTKLIWCVSYESLSEEHASFTHDFREFATTINTAITELRNAQAD